MNWEKQITTELATGERTHRPMVKEEDYSLYYEIE